MELRVKTPMFCRVLRIERVYRVGYMQEKQLGKQQTEE
jgi:hypothetical protein